MHALQRLLRGGHPAVLALLDLVDALSISIGEVTTQRRDELLHHLEVHAQRVDDDRALELLGSRCEHVEGEMPSPRVPDDPGLTTGRLVDHGTRVGHMRIDGERLAHGRRRLTALLVVDRGEGAVQQRDDRLEVGEGHPRAAMQDDGNSVAAAVRPACVDGAIRRVDDEGPVSQDVERSYNLCGLTHVAALLYGRRHGDGAGR